MHMPTIVVAHYYAPVACLLAFTHC